MKNIITGFAGILVALAVQAEPLSPPSQFAGGNAKSSAALMEAPEPDNIPVTATWVGLGDRTNVNAAANWDCRNASNERLDGAVPTRYTAITVSGATTFNVPAGQTLTYKTLTIGDVELAADCDWRGLGAGLEINGTVDVKGYKLSVAALNGSGTVTDTAEPIPQDEGDAACGELHVEVPARTTLENTSVTLAGALKLVKDGAGTLKASKAGQSYTGGTEVAAGCIMLGTNNGPVGQGNGSRTVSVADGATFDFNGLMNRASCRYHFVLDGGTVNLVGGSQDLSWDSTRASIASVTLRADSTLSGRFFYFGDGSVQLPFTFNGYTLNLDLDDYVYVKNLKAEDSGTISVNGGWGEFANGVTCDLAKVNIVFRNDGYMCVIDSLLALGGFAYERNYWANRNVNPPHITVAGNYQVGANRPPFTLLSGATLDFKDWPMGQIWNPAGRAASFNPNSGGTKSYSEPGLVTFAANGNFIVDVGDRAFPRGEWTQLVTWTEQPAGATFVLPSGSENKLQVDDTGLYIKNIFEIDDSTPVTATWVGEGDLDNVNAPANWSCYNSLGEQVNDAVPTADTVITVSGATTFNVPAGQTLAYKSLTIGDVELAVDCDWRGLGAGLVINGMVDVKGHKLSVAALKGSGTVTDTAEPIPQDEGDAACGELHVAVPARTTLENTTVTLSGALKLVKDGAGTLKASKAGQSYTGGTDVAEGGITLGTDNGPVGQGNGSRTVSVADGATFDFNGLMNSVSCRYQFVLDGGTVKLQGASTQQGWDAARASIASITLNADSTLAGKNFYFGHDSVKVPLTFNGHTLNLDVPNEQYVFLRSLKAEDAGTISVNGGWIELSHGADSDLTKANVVFRNDAYLTILNSMLALGGFAYERNYWANRNVNPPHITVAGNYQVGVNRPPFTLLSGATLDFKAWPMGQIWDPAGIAPSFNPESGGAKYYSAPGLVTFAANGNFFVDVGDRVFPPHEWTQLVAWTAKPAGVTFELVSEAENELRADDSGLYIREVTEIDNNTPVTATWVGEGDRANVNAPANWACYNIWGERLDDAVPTIDTAITVSGATSFNVPAGQTLVYGVLTIGDVELAADCDWRGLGARLVISGTVDVKGHKLLVAELKGSGTVTDTAEPTPQGECGELHVDVPAEATLANTSVTLAGALRLVKDGAGTLKASKAGQSYTGGTDVAKGVIMLGTNNGPVGPGNGTRTVTVAAGATFDFNGLMNTAQCRYHFVLDGGTINLVGGAQNLSWDDTRASIASVTLRADSTLSGRFFYFGQKTDKMPLTFNGYTLTIAADDYIYLRSLAAQDVGTLLVAGGRVEFCNDGAQSDLTKANVVFKNDAYLDVIKTALPVNGFAYERSLWGSRATASLITVAGNYQVGVNRPPFTLLSGATLDFKEWPAGQAWDPAGRAAVNTSTTAEYSDPGLVTFAAGNFIVDVGERRYPRERTKLVTWAAKPTGATFTLAPVSKKMNNVLQADETGLYIFYVGGMTILVR